MYLPMNTAVGLQPSSRTAGQDQVLFIEGEPCEYVYELQAGVARGVDISVDGERQITAFFFSGDQIGLPISDYYRFTLEAVTELSFVRLSPTCWRETFFRGHGNDKQLLSSICAEQDPMLRRGIIVGRHGILVRICAFLISVIDRLPEDGEFRVFPLPQADIAAYLATTPETVCRSFRQLREMGVIAMPRRDRLCVQDRAWLQALASGIEKQV